MEGRLPKKIRNNSGLYIVRHSKWCVACDYSDQANWLRYYGEPENPSDLPEGWVEDFATLKQAVKWLHGTRIRLKSFKRVIEIAIAL